jgi:hypothetical protein
MTQVSANQAAANNGLPESSTTKIKRRRTMSPATKAKLSAIMKARSAKQRATVEVQGEVAPAKVQPAAATQEELNSPNLDCGFRLLDRWRCLRLRHDALIPGLYPCSFLLGPHVSVPPRTVANHKWQSLRSKPP